MFSRRSCSTHIAVVVTGPIIPTLEIHEGADLAVVTEKFLTKCYSGQCVCTTDGNGRSECSSLDIILESSMMSGVPAPVLQSLEDALFLVERQVVHYMAVSGVPVSQEHSFQLFLHGVCGIGIAGLVYH